MNQEEGWGLRRDGKRTSRQSKPRREMEGIPWCEGGSRGTRLQEQDTGDKGGRCPTPLSLLTESCHWAVLIHLAELPKNLSASLLNIHR